MSDNTEEFTVKVKMEKRWIPFFLGMLDRMQYLGELGSSRDIVFFADGDGDFHPTFEWDIDVNLNPGKVTKSGEVFFDAG